MTRRLDVPVTGAGSASEAVRGADIVCTATTASQPIVVGTDLGNGVHINAIGANHAHKRELDDEAVAGARVIVVDSVVKWREEAGGLSIGFKGAEVCWTGVRKISEVVGDNTT